MNKYFIKALEVAKKGRGFTSPNPCVGAVIEKGGKIIATGFHKKAGMKHAEIEAIEELMHKSGIQTIEVDPMLFRNANLYLTLEPCCFEGRTPPCTDSLISAQFNSVNIASLDPNKKVKGKGVRALKKAGIKVKLLKNNDLKKEIDSLNQPYYKWITTGLPYVTLKAGMTLDGKIATSQNESKWITSDNSRKDSKIERSLNDAVIVGSGTVQSDNPHLDIVAKYSSKSFTKIVIDNKLQTSPDMDIYQGDVLVAHSQKAPKSRIAKFKKKAINIKSFGKDKVNIRSLLRFLGKQGLTSIFVEGGSSINGAFFDAGVVDKVIYYIAPKLMGGQDNLSVIGGEGLHKISKMPEFCENTFEIIGNDLKYTGVLNWY